MFLFVGKEYSHLIRLHSWFPLVMLFGEFRSCELAVGTMPLGAEIKHLMVLALQVVRFTLVFET